MDTLIAFVVIVLVFALVLLIWNNISGQKFEVDPFQTS